jgi:hypothetical protein
VGFEPTVPFGTHPFQGCTIGHSDTSPQKHKHFKHVGHGVHPELVEGTPLRKNTIISNTSATAFIPSALW